MDELAKDERISELYDLWYEKKHEVLKTYTSELPPKIPLSENKEFKSIKNEIIREAMRIHSEGGRILRIAPPQKDRDSEGSAIAVARLFHSLVSLFQDKIGGDGEKKLHVIDKRQKREIEDKKNAEITIV